MLSPKQLSTALTFLVFIASISALTPFLMDAYSPSMPTIAKLFKTSADEIELTMSIAIIGVAIGGFFGGPISDQIGRKPIGLLGLTVFTLASLVIMFVTTVESLLALRGIQALGCGLSISITRSQIRDVFSAKEFSKKYADVSMIAFFAPMLAPFIGSYLLGLSWQFIFLFLFIYALIILISYKLFFPETHATVQHKNQFFSIDFYTIFYSCFRAAKMRINQRLIPLHYVFFSAFSTGVAFSYVVNVSVIYIDYFGLSAYQFSTLFALNVAMLMIGNRASVYLMKRYSSPYLLKSANLLQVLLLLFLTIITTIEHIHWVVIVGLLMVVTIHGMIRVVVTGLYISFFSTDIGSASSLKGATNAIIGATIGTLAAFASNGKVMPIFAVMLISSVIAKLILHSLRDAPDNL